MRLNPADRPPAGARMAGGWVASLSPAPHPAPAAAAAQARADIRGQRGARPPAEPRRVRKNTAGPR